MESLLGQLRPVDWALLGLLALTGLLALVLRHRGGRFRRLPGWAFFAAYLAATLWALARLPFWVAFLLLSALLFAGLRTYFFVAPLRASDRYAVLAAYVAVPLALAAGFYGSVGTFLATVPTLLLLLFPAMLSPREDQQGFMDSLGRTLFGLLTYVLFPAHLVLLARDGAADRIVLFGALVLAAELPPRLMGRFRPKGPFVRPLVALVISLLVAGAIGYRVGPLAGLGDEDAARAGLLVALAASTGGFVASAVQRLVASHAAGPTLPRALFVERATPAFYAAPVFFHYLNQFA